MKFHYEKFTFVQSFLFPVASLHSTASASKIANGIQTHTRTHSVLPDMLNDEYNLEYRIANVTVNLSFNTLYRNGRGLFGEARALKYNDCI